MNVAQLITADKPLLTARAGRLTPAALRSVEAGMRLVLGLPR